MDFQIPRMNLNSHGISLFSMHSPFLFPVVAIHFSSITELKLFPYDATNQMKKVICK